MDAVAKLAEASGIDFSFTEEQQRFRRQIRDWFRREVPSGMEARPEMGDTDEVFTWSRGFARRLAAKGWLCIGWPKEYGGGGYGLIEQAIFEEEIRFNRANFFATDHPGIRHIGPLIRLVGTEQQKQLFLGRIASGEWIMSTGLSEPNAGSDLAGLETRAVRDGSDYILTGQKTFQSGAHRADWAMVAARTSQDLPRNKGVSVFMVDLKTRGVTIQAQPNMADGRQNNLFLDDVHVPANMMLGQENGGWAVLRTGLNIERIMVGHPATQFAVFEELLAFCREPHHGARPLIENESVRRKLAEVAIGLQAWRLLTWKAVWMQAKGIFGHESSLATLYEKSSVRRLIELEVDILGAFSLVRKGSPWAPLAGRIEREYRRSFGYHGGGTAEIQKIIVATRGLGMPRGS